MKQGTSEARYLQQSAKKNYDYHHQTGHTFQGLRMTTPSVLSFLDFFFRKRELPPLESFPSMLGSATSFSSFLLSSGNADVMTISWLSLCYIALIPESVYLKYVVSNSGTSTLDQSFYQNLFSITVFMYIVMFTEIDAFRLPRSSQDTTQVL